MTGSRRIFRGLALAALAVGALALLAEGLVLLVAGSQDRSPTRLVESPIGLRLMEPNSAYWQQTKESRVEIRVNGQGMRADREFAYAKPPGMRRIVSLGDSTTVGFTVDVEETFGAVLEDRLNAAGIPVEVLNAGVPGFGTAEELVYFERELVRYAPDLVLVNFYESDIKDNVRSPLYRWEQDRLVPGATRYYPDARMTDLLRSQPVLRWLDEHSNAFAFARGEAAAFLRQRRMQAQAEASGDRGAATVAPEAFTRTDPPRRMTAALFDAFLESTGRLGIPLVIQSIPSPAWPHGELVLQEVFPVEFFDADRPGVHLLLGMDVLPPVIGDLAPYRRTNHHYAPDGHRVMGEALAALVLERGLLGSGEAGAAATPPAAPAPR